MKVAVWAALSAGRRRRRIWSPTTCPRKGGHGRTKSPAGCWARNPSSRTAAATVRDNVGSPHLFASVAANAMIGGGNHQPGGPSGNYGGGIPDMSAGVASPLQPSPTHRQAAGELDSILRSERGSPIRDDMTMWPHALPRIKLKEVHDQRDLHYKANQALLKAASSSGHDQSVQDRRGLNMRGNDAMYTRVRNDHDSINGYLNAKLLQKPDGGAELSPRRMSPEMVGKLQRDGVARRDYANKLLVLSPRRGEQPFGIKQIVDSRLTDGQIAIPDMVDSVSRKPMPPFAESLAPLHRDLEDKMEELVLGRGTTAPVDDREKFVRCA